MDGSAFPSLAMSGKLAVGAKVWLPNLDCIEQSLQDFRSELDPHFVIRKEVNPTLNPLYVATENAEEALLLCPDLITNATQLVHMIQHSQGEGLFYVLELRAAKNTDKPLKAVSAESTDKHLKARAVARVGAKGKKTTGADKVTVVKSAKVVKAKRTN